MAKLEQITGDGQYINPPIIEGEIKLNARHIDNNLWGRLLGSSQSLNGGIPLLHLEIPKLYLSDGIIMNVNPDQAELEMTFMAWEFRLEEGW